MAVVAAAPEAVREVSANVPRGRVDILGVPLDRVTKQEAVDCLFRGLHSPDQELFTVATLNPEYVMAARSLPGFRNAIERSNLIVCDGIGTLAAARALHRRAASGISRLTGVDLTLLLARWTGFEATGGLFLLGGMNAPGAAEGLVRQAPNASIVGAWSGGTPEPAMDDETIRRIRASGASIVLVAYGAPAQVLWIERNREGLCDAGIRVAMGVGGALDYFSGDAVLAPPLMRRAGLEWLYRLVREPRRIRRQLVLPVFALLVARDALRAGLPFPSPACIGSRREKA